MTSRTSSESDKFKMGLKRCPVNSLPVLAFSVAILIYFILACFVFRLG